MSIYTSYAEQEHADHVAGCASEFQNCYSEARSKVSQLAAQHGTRIHRARSLGLWVVIDEVDYHCRATDAFAGTYEHFISAHPAEAVARGKAAELNSDPEDRFSVLPPL